MNLKRFRRLYALEGLRVRKDPSPVAAPSICRQAPEVGAVCVNCACTDLCGGRPVTVVPTANRRS